MNTAYVIAVDWGTSNLRAHLCEILPNRKFKVLATKEGPGVSKVNGDFETELMTLTKKWRNEFSQLPMLLSGLIGSSIGWKEVPYLSCPVSPHLLADSYFNFNCQGHDMYIVPGVSCCLSDGYHEVMRGEELQVLGWLQLNDNHKLGRHLICLPGTHTKWVLVENAEIQYFKTSVTGELYDILCQHSVLIQNQHSRFSNDVFTAAAQYSLASQQDSLIHSLFSTRSKQLFNDIRPEDAPSWLSGLLIGSDVRAACNARQWQMDDFQKVAIIGNGQLADCFSVALAIKEIETEVFDVTATSIAGFSSFYQAKFNSNTED